MILDMSFTLSMIYERNLYQALNSRNLDGYFDHVVSVHPLSSLFKVDQKRFGAPSVISIDNYHLFVEGTIGITRFLAWLPPLNLLLAQAWLFFLLYR